MTLTALINGAPATIEISESQLASLQPKPRAPLCGYVALRQALAEVGIKKGLRTLKTWVAKRKIPHRHFRGKVTFYLDEVLEKIGGRS